MFNQLGTIDVVCDAPCYEIVTSCRLLGFARPEDVRWSRLVSGRDHSHESRWRAFFRRTWEVLSGKPKHEPTCSCGVPLPLLQEHVFLSATGFPVLFLIGQCPRCLTIYWDDVPPVLLLE